MSTCAIIISKHAIVYRHYDGQPEIILEDLAALPSPKDRHLHLIPGARLSAPSDIDYAYLVTEDQITHNPTPLSS